MRKAALASVGMMVLISLIFVLAKYLATAPLWQQYVAAAICGFLVFFGGFLPLFGGEK